MPLDTLNIHCILKTEEETNNRKDLEMITIDAFDEFGRSYWKQVSSVSDGIDEICDNAGIHPAEEIVVKTRRENGETSKLVFVGEACMDNYLGSVNL